MVNLRRFVIVSLLLATIWAWLQPAQAQIVRCVGRDGSTIYTDRRCEDIGAISRLPRGEAGTSTTGISRRYGCARTLQDLVYEITTAIDNRDVNRLGGVYHWVGVGADNGYRILEKLQVVADRQLVDIVPVHGRSTDDGPPPTQAPPPVQDEAPSPVATTTRPDGAIEEVLPRRNTSLADAVAPPRRVRRTPVALRLQQASRGGSATSPVVFGLHRHLDCWWITL